MNDALNEYMSNRFQKGNTNALDELKRSVGSFENIICAEIKVWESYEEGKDFEYEFYLKEHYTQDDLNTFLNGLKEINYDSGYGGQNLFGTVWLKNNSWLERGEYDGSEWWEFKQYPLVPDHLKTSIIKKYGVDFSSGGGALTLDPYHVFDPESGENYKDYVNKGKASSRTHDNGWTITGEISEDYYEWVNHFEGSHPTFGKVWGDFEDTIYATSEEGYQDFYKNFTPTEWDYGDI